MATELELFLFALRADVTPIGTLESRMHSFLASQSGAEALDSPSFARANGSASKADFLLDNRHFVAELKTINGNPKGRLEERLRARFARPGGPIVFGDVGLARILKGMPDEKDLTKLVLDLSARSIGRHLRKASEQVAATRSRFLLRSARGLVVIMNDAEPLIDVGNVAYSLKATLEAVSGGYPELSLFWISIETHKIRMPDGRLGFPQVLVTRGDLWPAEIAFCTRLLHDWATYNSGALVQINHRADWEAMRPVFDERPPALDLF